MNKKILLAGILLLLSNCILFSQSNVSLLIKEDCDHYQYLLHDKFPVCDSNLLSDSSDYGNKFAYLLESNLDMFELSFDKGYLYQFIEISLCMLENRRDVFSSSSSFPIWSFSVYENGNIIGAFSRFVFVVNSNNLNSELLSQFPFIANNFFGEEFSTFGSYASWIQDRCGETIWYYLTNGFWSNSQGIKKSPGEEYGGDINMQSGFARALLYVGLCSGEESFLLKASIIESLILGSVSIDDGCEDYEETLPVLQLDSITNAYGWYHSGWHLSEHDCLWALNTHDKGGYFQYQEDISHGAIVMNMVMDFYNYHNGTDLTEVDMERFKNMFTQKIYLSPGKFANSVFGTMGPIYFNDNQPTDYFDTSFYKVRALHYAPLSAFDGGNDTSNNVDVYDIIMNLYLTDYANWDTLPYTPLDNWGHAKVVKMQWDNSCPDLHLYRRQIVYDQDFWSKGDLIINGIDERVDYTFMHPTNFESPVFEIVSGVSSAISSSQEVDLQNFHAKEGSDVHIFVNDELCEFKSKSGTEKSMSIVEEEMDTSNLTQDMGSIEIFPNPCAENFTVSLKGNLDDIRVIQIIDLRGKMVRSDLYESNDRANAHQVLYEIGDLKSGVYIIQLMNAAGQWKSQKLMIQ